ncbi:hypothetical protein LCGC14_1403020 [marine sediment metagenome]|uniref:Uncharacterized protein n=1 Tax=marine sediment metagenome TaxID=412755 RepID=A0A0F9MY19_9ZZZZ
MDELAQKALCIIEVISGHDLNPKHTDMDEIFKLAHHALAVNCRKNHLSWGKDIEKTYETMLKNGLTRSIHIPWYKRIWKRTYVRPFKAYLSHLFNKIKRLTMRTSKDNFNG